MPDQRLQIIIEAVDRASAQIKSVVASLGVTEKQLKATGKGLTVFGAAGVAAFGLMVKAAQDEQVGINQLDQALNKLGLSYAQQKSAIEGVVEAQQRKTNFGDDAQRQSLQQMIALSGNYEASLAALPVALDLASALHIDLASATNLVGRGLAGNTDLFARYGIEIEAGATATELITKLTEKFGGAAEAAANPFVQMKNEIENAGEAIGAVLLPVVTDAAKRITEMATMVSQLDPTLLKLGVSVTAVVVAFAALAGPILLFLVNLPAMIAGVGTLTTAFVGLGVAINGSLVAITPLIPLLAALGAVFVAANAQTKDAIPLHKELQEQIDRERSSWAQLERNMAESHAKGQELAESLKKVGGSAQTTGMDFIALNAAVEEAGNQFKQVESPMTRMFELMDQLGLSSDEFVAKADAIAERLGIGLDEAMRLLAETTIPLLESKVRHIAEGFADFGDTAEDAADKASEAAKQAARDAEEAARKIRMAIEETDRKAEESARDARIRQNLMMGGGSFALAQFGSALELARSFGRPELAIAAFGRGTVSGMTQEQARAALEQLAVTSQAQAIARQEDLTARIKAEVARLRSNGIIQVTLNGQVLAQEMGTMAENEEAVRSS